MKALFLGLAALLAATAAAYDVYVWNFDPYDTYYDSEAGATTDCSYWIIESLAAHGDDVDSGADLPSDLTPYDAVFVTLGFYRC